MARLNYVKSFRGTTKTESGNLRCGRCGDSITKGDGYRWWANRAPGQRGSFRNIRCMKSECTPTTAERTPGRMGEFLYAQENAQGELAAWRSESPTDAPEDVLTNFADALREIANEMQEGADNIESGFGHATSQSEELADRAQQLESTADDAESVSFENAPERDEFDEGDDGDEEFEHALETWRDECESAAQDAIDNAEMP